MNVPINTLKVDNVNSRYYVRTTTYTPTLSTGQIPAYLKACMKSPLFSFRSTHTGGAQFLYCDGSVNFLTENIDMAVYKALGSRANGDIVNEH